MTTLQTLTPAGAVDQTLTPLLVTGLDWEQRLNRTVNTPGRADYVQLQLGTPTAPAAVLQILLGTWAALEQLRLMYAGGLTMVLTDPVLGLTWRHAAVDTLRYSPVLRPGRPAWWLLTVAAEQVPA